MTSTTVTAGKILDEAALARIAERLEAVRAAIVRTLSPDDLAAISAAITELRAMTPSFPAPAPGHAPVHEPAHANPATDPHATKRT